MTEERVYTEDMGEISGFGGGYEASCRAMVLGGLRWFDEHPDADPKFQAFENIDGILRDGNEDARALSEAMIAATPERNVMGAMHQESVAHVFFIRKNGWSNYAQRMRESKASAQGLQGDG